MVRAGDSHGFRLPDDRSDLTEDEMRWMELLRDLSSGRVRPPRLAEVQALRQVMWRAPCDWAASDGG